MLRGGSTRVFEDKYHRYMSRLRNYSLALSGVLVGFGSLLRMTFLYVFEIAGLSLSLRLSGLRLRRELDYVKVSIVIAGITALLELIFSKPTLRLMMLSSNLASSLSLVLGGATIRWALPNIVGAGYYIATHDYPLGAATLAYIAFMPLLIHAINRVTGINSIGLLRGFALESVHGPSLFEKHLESLPLKEKELRAHVFLIKHRGTGEKLVLVATDAHPGPFGGVGGSIIIQELKRALEEKGYTIAFLHGVGGHENDIVSNEEARGLVKAIEAAARRLDEEPVESGDEARSMCRPSLTETRSFTITTLCLDGRRFSVISAKHKSSDDLPATLSTLEDKYGVVLIDAQNTYMVDNGYDHNDAREIEEALSRLGEAHSCAEGRIGFAAVQREELDEEGLEIGPLGARILVLECDGERTALIILDGNNMVPELRRRIMEAVKGLVDHAEVATTDNHSLVGLRGKRGYRVIGETVSSEKIIEKIRRGLEEAIGKLGQADVRYTQVRFKARVLGEEGFGLLMKAVSRTSIAASIYIASLVLPPLIIS